MMAEGGIARAEKGVLEVPKRKGGLESNVAGAQAAMADPGNVGDAPTPVSSVLKEKEVKPSVGLVCGKCGFRATIYQGSAISQHCPACHAKFSQAACRGNHAWGCCWWCKEVK
ncbi:hypothetical protein ES703_64106 [subsurface metagenome]